MAVIGIAMVMLGCTQTAWLRASGEAIDAVGRQFLVTASAIDDARRAGQVTDDEYAAWVAYTREFQRSYAVAVATWRVAASGSPQQAEAVTRLAVLRAGLEPFIARTRR
jgi:hypothetical protein